jgi:hypothetical protein
MKSGILIGIILSVAAVSPALATAADSGNNSADSWQLSMLFKPSEHQLELEGRGRVMIYDGMRSADVNRALEEKFDRIESMMFVNTVVTDDDGIPVRDPESGLVLVEEDGCD